MRLDQALVQVGLVSTRSQALQHIRFGHVTYKGEKVTKPSLKVSSLDDLQLNSKVYVGRGAQKLLKALESFSFAIEGRIAADVGASTGGFTQVLLNYGVQKVYAIDVGHGQLAKDLESDERVINLEGHHINEFANAERELPEKVDLLVADLSFISLSHCLDGMKGLMKSGAEIITLVKPQFEVGKEFVGKGGIVKDPDKHFQCLRKLSEEFASRGFHLYSADVSPITGKAGNREYLFYLQLLGAFGEVRLSDQDLRSLTHK